MIRRVSYSLRGEHLVQFACGHWWVGSGWPFVAWQRYGNQLYRWSLSMRLPGNRELEWNGAAI